MIEGADREKFAKLKCENILDLALILPHSYRDLRLNPTYTIDSFQATKVIVKSSHFEPKRLIIKLHSLSWDVPIDAVFFNAKPWQRAQFNTDRELVIYGKITHSFGSLQIVQPIITKEQNSIVPIYKTSMRNDYLIALISKHITISNLQEMKLPSWVADRILAIHTPKELIRLPFDGKNLQAVKLLEIFRFLHKLKSKKTTLKASCFFDADPSGFVDSLPFELTADQKRTIEEIRADLSKQKQARRLVIGDVGSGKTMVILATAYMSANRKSILMAPTSILANQLYEEACKYLPLKTVLVTQKTAIKDSELSGADFLIGTHALLYKTLPEVACVMVDEQHRFGSQQRKLLADLTSKGASRPHFFQFSATPIPRTLAMIQSSLLDISTIRTMPFEKQIETKVIGKDGFATLYKHIADQIANDAQVLIVYPLVKMSESSEYQGLEEATAFWQKHFDAVYTTHGKDKEKEAVLLEFREKGKILLATTVVEVGISLPRLNTVVIAGAERLGLATLHQLRGRVGRMGQQSWCFFYTNSPKNERLNELANTLDGFKVAELDLKTRESGDLLSGVVQSGANFVWFDMASDEDILAEAKGVLDD